MRYSIGSNTYTIEKRDTLRSIFLQILIFSLNAVYTMCVDKKMELMLFATGHIYRKKVAGLQNRSAQLEFRVKWLQRGAMLLIVVGVACYSISTTGVDYNYSLRYATIWIGACGQICVFGLCYNNISLDLVKSLFKDPTVYNCYRVMHCQCHNSDSFAMETTFARYGISFFGLCSFVYCPGYFYMQRPLFSDIYGFNILHIMHHQYVWMHIWRLGCRRYAIPV